MVLMAVMGFADAFKSGALLLSVLTGAFDAGGLVFMILPIIGPDNWTSFFLAYAVFAVACAVAVFIIFPDENLPAYSEDEPEESDLAEMGAAIKDKAGAHSYDAILNIWQPLIASSTFPVCLAV